MLYCSVQRQEEFGCSQLWQIRSYQIKLLLVVILNASLSSSCSSSSFHLSFCCCINSTLSTYRAVNVVERKRTEQFSSRCLLRNFSVFLVLPKLRNVSYKQIYVPRHYAVARDNGFVEARL